MISKSVLFIILPVPSHYFVAFSFAEILQDKGMKISFSGPSMYKDLVEKEGYEFIEMDCYLPANVVKNIKVFIAFLLKSLTDPFFIKKNYDLFLSYVNSMNSVLLKVNPTLVVLDNHMFHYKTLLEPYRNKLIILNTKLSTRKAMGIPPLQVAWISTNSFTDIARANFDWFKLLIRYESNTLLLKLAFLGKGDTFFLKRYAKKHKINQKNFFIKTNCFGLGIRGNIKVITYPKALEYPWRKEDKEEVYIETKFKRRAKFLDEKYLRIEEALSSRKNDNKKIIYCSMGSATENRLNTIISFLQKVIKAFENNPFVELIISTCGLPLEVKPCNNVLIFSLVSQVDILKYADVMINHGGLNSITECIQAKVPMVVYPFLSTADHWGNSARVVANQFGKRGDMKRDSASEIRKTVFNVLNDSVYKKNLNGILFQSVEEKKTNVDRLLSNIDV